MVTRNPNGAGAFSVPLFGAERPTEETPTAKTQKIESFIPGLPVKAGQAAVEVIHMTEMNEDGTITERVVVKAAACAGCGRHFATSQEAAASCTFCHYSVCLACTTSYRCNFCGRQGCSYSKCGDKQDDLFLCHLHVDKRSTLFDSEE